MKKLAAILLASGTMLCMMVQLAPAESFTTGITFTLPETFPLHNVYVGTNSLDLLLPGSPTIEALVVTPAGFDVPVGSSAFDLNSLRGVASERWAVIGLFTDAEGGEHVVMATNADLSGVPLEPPLTPLGFSGADIVAVLTRGDLGGLLAEGGIVDTWNLHGFTVPFGETAELFFFSNGQPIPGGSVTANAFGVPGPRAVPEPSTLFLLGIGAFGLLGCGRRRRERRRA